MKERWRQVVIDSQQWPYEVSDFGRVRRTNRDRFKIPSKNHAGAFFVRLNMNGKTKNIFVHRLEANAFIGIQPKNHEINHKDGNRENNLPNNLEWVTRHQNLLHACQSGLKKPCCGEKNGRAKLTRENVLTIKGLLSKNLTQRQISEMFNVSRSTVKMIAEKRSWTWV